LNGVASFVFCSPDIAGEEGLDGLGFFLVLKTRATT
jgi:hypothetical protein